MGPLDTGSEAHGSGGPLAWIPLGASHGSLNWVPMGIIVWLTGWSWDSLTHVWQLSRVTK